MTQIENAGQGKYADQLRDHRFDGIQEFDNHLPNWWLWSFYLACIFSLFYWLYYHGLGWGDTSRQSYEAEMDAAAARMVVENVTDESLEKLGGSADAIAAGKALFLQNCVACHGPAANGMIAPGVPGLGPNLTDNAWINGGAPTQIYNTIWNGVGEKGMVPWFGLGPTKVQQLAAYVLSLRDSNAPGGKEPQGEPYPPK